MSKYGRLSSPLCPHVIAYLALNRPFGTAKQYVSTESTNIIVFTQRTSLALHIAALFGSQPPNHLGQIQQVFCTEQGSALGDRDKGIDSDDVSPTGRERNQLLFVVVEVDSILTPGTLVRNQFKRLAPERMERVNDVKDSRRNVTLRRSCQCGPMPPANRL